MVIFINVFEIVERSIFIVSINQYYHILTQIVLAQTSRLKASSFCRKDCRLKFFAERKLPQTILDSRYEAIFQTGVLSKKARRRDLSAESAKKPYNYFFRE